MAIHGFMCRDHIVCDKQLKNVNVNICKPPLLSLGVRLMAANIIICN